jgi:hypothetical protein
MRTSRKRRGPAAAAFARLGFGAAISGFRRRRPRPQRDLIFAFPNKIRFAVTR